jgi:AraC family transcriptional regulator
LTASLAATRCPDGPGAARTVFHGLERLSGLLAENVDAHADLEGVSALLSSARQLLRSAYLTDLDESDGEQVTARRLRLSQTEREAIVRFIDAKLGEKLSRGRLAAALQRGERSFSEAFRATFHCSPMQYVIQRRVETAMKLLRETELSLPELALDCGFNDQAHMTRAFHERTGETPARWRRQDRILQAIAC